MANITTTAHLDRAFKALRSAAQAANIDTRGWSWEKGSVGNGTAWTLTAPDTRLNGAIGVNAGAAYTAMLNMADALRLASEQPVPKPESVPLIFGGGHLACRNRPEGATADCGSTLFYPMGRSLDHYYWKCATCNTRTQSLTETGASS